MATSTIFEQIWIRDPQKADAFLDALEAAAEKPRRKSVPVKPPLTDYNEIRRLMAKGDMAE